MVPFDASPQRIHNQASERMRPGHLHHLEQDHEEEAKPPLQVNHPKVLNEEIFGCVQHPNPHATRSS